MTELFSYLRFSMNCMSVSRYSMRLKSIITVMHSIVAKSGFHNVTIIIISRKKEKKPEAIKWINFTVNVMEVSL